MSTATKSRPSEPGMSTATKSRSIEYRVYRALQFYHKMIAWTSTDETWLQNDEVDPLPSGYSMIRNDRGDRGGGVANIYKNKYKVKKLNIDVARWSMPSSIEIIGDFNVDMGSANRKSNRVEVMSQKYGFEQLDLCFFKKTRECAVNVVVEDLLVSDHNFVLVESYITTKPSEKECLVLVDELIKGMLYCYDNFIPNMVTDREGGALESNTSEKTKRFMAIRKYHYDFWKRTGLGWHKTKCKEYEKLVRIALKRDMHDMEEKLPETLCPEKLNNFYCEMGFMAGKPVKDTLPHSIAEKPKDDSFLFYVKNVNQSDLFLAWKRVRRKLSNKPDTMGISKVFLDKLMPIPAFNEALLKIIQKSFVEGIVPESMKIARVQPIAKVANAKEMSQFRPVAISSNLLLIIETIYHMKSAEFIKTNSEEMSGT
ncbi:unnamed protein product [Orchesella dallaii]